jgi:hypothetical protein
MTATEAPRTQWIDARWIRAQTGLSLARIYSLWNAAAEVLDIPPYGCMRPNEAREFLQWMRDNSPKAREKVENLLNSSVFV